MLIALFLKGFLIGFMVAIPIGPVGMLSLQHSLQRGILAGIISGLGAAAADGFYGGMAAYGVSLLSHIITRYQIWFQIFASLLLCIMGIKIYHTQPKDLNQEKTSFSYSRVFFSTFALTLTNPLTFICFAAVYTTLGITPTDQDFWQAAALSQGVLLGAAIWWTIFTLGVTKIGKKFQLSSSPFLNRVSGGFLTGCGFITSLSVLKQLVFLA